MSSFYFNYLVKTKSIAKKVLMFLYCNWLILQTQERKGWYGGGGWTKKLKHWLKLMAISTFKIDFAFDGS